MAFSFRQKLHPSSPDTPTLQLVSFVFLNRDFLRITLLILARIAFTCNDIERPLRQSPHFRLVQSNKLMVEYLSLMQSFYRGVRLPKRRGDFLELLIARLGPVCGVTSFASKTECKAYRNGTPISRKDIDVVFIFSRYELIECKCTLENFIPGEPFPRKAENKLLFIKGAQQLVVQHGFACDVYLGTLSNDEAGELHNRLQNNGYADFVILTRDRILKRCLA